MNIYYDDIGLLRVESHSPFSKISYKGIELTKKLDAYSIETLDIEKPNFVVVDGETYPIIMRGIVKTDWFDLQYSYNGKLGAFVEGDQTTFRLWAPTSHHVSLILNNDEVMMTRIEKGVFEVSFDSNLLGSDYLYKVKRFDEEILLTDPYAKASLPNRVASVVVDNSVTKYDGKRFKADENPIILEMSVRDFSMDPKVDFENRGILLGVMESHGNYGFNHIKDLGVSHVQFMPINDFETVDELNPFDKYNWGYDTMQYMALEGSYSSDVSNPLQVIEDFKSVVNFYHSHGIGINLDLVFNHVYDVETHPLNQSLPYYFFRYTEDYTLSNGSFCGNEIASEMTMMRKLIVETCRYYVDTFDIDGFRFDLMGLMDVDTINTINEVVSGIKENVLIYGEGWSMPSVLNKEHEASMKNFSKMPGVAHFNDKFRDIVGGKVDGSTKSIDTDLLSLSSLNEILNGSYQILGQAKQSINYVECHDNYTLADRLKMHGKTHSDAELINDFVIYSNGVPFLQIGQSFFRNKKGEENSYNLSDSINAIQWDYLETYRELNEAVKRAIALRKQAKGHLFEITDKNTMFFEKK